MNTEIRSDLGGRIDALDRRDRRAKLNAAVAAIVDEQ